MSDPASRGVSDFLGDLASDAPTPGGGTASAIAGGMGAALVEMVVALTLAREKYAAAHDTVRPIAEAARDARSRFLALAREDSEAYDEVVRARRLPKETPEEKAARSERIAEANRRASEVPLQTAELAVGLMALLPELAEAGNPNAASDAGCAALLLASAAEGALLNVAINLAGISDAELVGVMGKKTTTLQEDAERLRDRVIAAVRKRM